MLPSTGSIVPKVSSRNFHENVKNSPDISKGFCRTGISRFESFQVSQAFRRSAKLPKKCEIGPEIPAFRALASVSRHPVCCFLGTNCRKFPASYANIPVLRRLQPETEFDQDCRPRLAVFTSVSYCGFESVSPRRGIPSIRTSEAGSLADRARDVPTIR